MDRRSFLKGVASAGAAVFVPIATNTFSDDAHSASGHTEWKETKWSTHGIVNGRYEWKTRTISSDTVVEMTVAGWFEVRDGFDPDSSMAQLIEYRLPTKYKGFSFGRKDIARNGKQIKFHIISTVSLDDFVFGRKTEQQACDCPDGHDPECEHIHADQLLSDASELWNCTDACRARRAALLK